MDEKNEEAVKNRFPKVRRSNGEGCGLVRRLGLSGRYYSDSTRSPSSTQMGTTKSVVFGRVVMGIRARGIDEGADGVAIFYPEKTWALGSTWS